MNGARNFSYSDSLEEEKRFNEIVNGALSENDFPQVEKSLEHLHPQTLYRLFRIYHLSQSPQTRTNKLGHHIYRWLKTWAQTHIYTPLFQRQFQDLEAIPDPAGPLSLLQREIIAVHRVEEPQQRLDLARAWIQPQDVFGLIPMLIPALHCPQTGPDENDWMAKLVQAQDTGFINQTSVQLVLWHTLSSCPHPSVVQALLDKQGGALGSAALHTVCDTPRSPLFSLLLDWNVIGHQQLIKVCQQQADPESDALLSALDRNLQDAILKALNTSVPTDEDLKNRFPDTFIQRQAHDRQNNTPTPQNVPARRRIV